MTLNNSTCDLKLTFMWHDLEQYIYITLNMLDCDINQVKMWHGTIQVMTWN